MKTFYVAVKPTNSVKESGAPEIGSACEHEHETAHGATVCAKKRCVPGCHDWRPAKYEREDGEQFARFVEFVETPIW